MRMPVLHLSKGIIIMKTNNEEFKAIQGGFSSYKSDLTIEAKRLIMDTIKDSMKSSNKPYSASKVYYVVYNSNALNFDGVKYWLQRYYATHTDEPLPQDATIRKYVTVVKKVAKALVDAHSQGMKLFKTAEEGKHYMNEEQQYQIKFLIEEGVATEDLLDALKSMMNKNENI